MRPHLRRLAFCALSFVAATVFMAGATVGQDLLCDAQVLGRVACLADRLCVCQFTPGSYASRLPDGFRWDCGIMRPYCGGPVPASLNPWPSQLPDALAIDRSRTIIKDGPAFPYGWPRH